MNIHRQLFCRGNGSRLPKWMAAIMLASLTTMTAVRATWRKRRFGGRYDTSNSFNCIRKWRKTSPAHL